MPAGDGAGYLLLLDRPHARENPNYALARDLGRLRPLEIETVPVGAGVRVLARMVELGIAHGAAKPPLLDARTDWFPNLKDH